MGDQPQLISACVFLIPQHFHHSSPLTERLLDLTSWPAVMGEERGHNMLHHCFDFHFLVFILSVSYVFIVSWKSTRCLHAAASHAPLWSHCLHICWSGSGLVQDLIPGFVFVEAHVFLHDRGVVFLYTAAAAAAVSDDNLACDPHLRGHFHAGLPLESEQSLSHMKTDTEALARFEVGVSEQISGHVDDVCRRFAPTCSAPKRLYQVHASTFSVLLSSLPDCCCCLWLALCQVSDAGFDKLFFKRGSHLTPNLIIACWTFCFLPSGFFPLRPVGEPCHWCPAATAPTSTVWGKSPRRNSFRNPMWVTLPPWTLFITYHSFYKLLITLLNLNVTFCFLRASAKTAKLEDQICGRVWR